LGEKLSRDIIPGYEPLDPETAPEKKQQGQRPPRKPNPNGNQRNKNSGGGGGNNNKWRGGRR
jgi:hypothetical protein